MSSRPVISSGGMIPRPMGEQLRASEPRQMLHFDFCEDGGNGGGHRTHPIAEGRILWLPE